MRSRYVGTVVCPQVLLVSMTPADGEPKTVGFVGSLRKIGEFCNDARVDAGSLYLRRMNGEIVR